MTKKKKEKRAVNHFAGVLPNVCVHRVTFRYWDFTSELTPELEERLTEAAEERARECIIEGCHSGDLVCISPDNEEEIWGWWEIDDG